ncbi:MAG: hypothetical protein LBR45_00435 [Bacteroidales bacterium]|jgi:hypothetical protein|nr:hypothetical protein [Bacteroidales bacterium]
MRKKSVFLAVVALLATMYPVKADGIHEGPEPGTHLLGIRVGTGWGHLHVNAAYDYALARVGKGTFTIGGYLSESSNMDDRNELAIPIMARTTYRFSVVVPEWEVYGGVMLGGFMYFDPRKSGMGGFVCGSAFLGTSYYFNKNFGVNLEVGGGFFAPFWNIGGKFRF